MDAIHYTEARATLASLMDRVCDDHEPVIITRQKARAVVMVSLDDFNGWMETLSIMGSPANAAHLRESIAQLQSGRVDARELIER